MKKLIEHLQNNLIEFKKISDNIVKIDQKTFQLVYPNESGQLFDDLFELTCPDTEEDNYIFQFGGKYYWTPKGSETNPQLNPVKYLGSADIQPPFIPWLGIHGKYEILNGSRNYNSWCEKAKFLSCDTLGICELNTLAGVVQFQEACRLNDIKSILGATYIVRNQKLDIQYRIKIYAKDELGWQTLLKINKQVNVDNEGFADEEYFWQTLQNVVIVVDPKYIDFDYFQTLKIKSEIYYQLDTVQYDNINSDKDYLINLGKFIQSNIEPVLIQDSYYLDQEDYHVKEKLNIISSVREFKSKNQYFKCFDQIYDELDLIFSKESETFEAVLERSVKNLIHIADQCIFNINFNTFHLPDYILTEKQKDKFINKETLFEYLIEKGLRNKVNENVRDIYRERVKKELKVIKMGEKLIDYFLILWDIIQWCHDNDILVGVGRGSSAGCLISYLLDIVQVDPIKYNLLFERFLNENRIGKKVDCEKIILQTIKGDIELWHDKKVLVLRGDIELNLKASEIKEKDKIIEIY